MLAERERLNEKSTGYESEDDLSRPLYFQNIEGYTHELQYDSQEEHAPKFNNEHDPFEFFELFMILVSKYNIIHEDEIMKMFTLPLRRHIGFQYYGLASKHISLICGFINVFLKYVMGDQFIEVKEESISFGICKEKDQVVNALN